MNEPRGFFRPHGKKLECDLGLGLGRRKKCSGWGGLASKARPLRAVARGLYEERKRELEEGTVSMLIAFQLIIQKGRRGVLLRPPFCIRFSMKLVSSSLASWLLCQGFPSAFV